MTTEKNKNSGSGLGSPMHGSFLAPYQCEECIYRTRAPYSDGRVSFDNGWKRDSCEMYPGGDDGWKPGEIMRNDAECIFRTVPEK